ncbi:MAG: hypothetical protein FJ291_20005 [Planctomycetes bacterium]|nr:hypothetical protein [Planctomycetota bacterium]
MAKLPRVAVMFRLAGADFRTRGFLAGIHRWAEDHPGRWELVHDASPQTHLGDFQGVLGRGSEVVLAEARRLGVPYVAAALVPGRSVLLSILNISQPSVSVTNATGTKPDGTPYIDLALYASGGVLDPAEAVNVAIRFANPLRRSFTFGLIVEASV